MSDKPTNGPYGYSRAKLPVDGEYDWAVYINDDGKKHCIAEAFGKVDYVQCAPAEAHAELIADAFNTYNKTQLLPSEILGQRDALAKALEQCASIVERNLHRQNEKVDDVKIVARQALASIGGDDV